MRSDLSGKVLLITGAGSGIGRACALVAQQAGAKLALSDVDTDELEVTYDMLGTDDAFRMTANITAAEEVSALFDEVVRYYGRLDALLHCAGIEVVVPSEEMSEEAWDDVIDTNLKGTFLCNQHAIRHMLSAGHGVILNVASQFGLVGYPLITAYSASKGGVVQMTKSLALEYADRNIRVNCLCPGPTATPLTGRLMLSAKGAARDAILEMSKVPMGRVAKPEEMAETILFLLSDGSSYLTGSAVSADGGWTAR